MILKKQNSLLPTNLVQIGDYSDTEQEKGKPLQRIIFCYSGDMEKGEKKRLVLFDAHAIIHRAYHALPDFRTKAGEPTGGLYGLTTMLLKSIDVLKPDYIAACYDLPGPTFRHKEYKEYKAGRAKVDDELKQQLQTSRKVFTAFGIPIYDAPGYEADDMLGTIVEQTKKLKEIEVVIVTGDMDSLQLVDQDKVKVFTLKKGINDTVLYNEDAVEKRFGFGPKLLPDFKGLRGDPSDNIVGIKGIGEKTATQLITTFGGIEGIYQMLSKHRQKLLEAGIKERIVGLLEQGEDEAKFSKMLATIRRDAPISFQVPAQTWKEALVLDDVLNLMTELEFLSLRVRIERELGGVRKVAIEEQGNGESVLEEPAMGDEELRSLLVALWLLDSDKVNPTTDDCLEYTGEHSLGKAKEKILQELKQLPMWSVYEEIELPLIPIVRRAEEKGILVDVDFLDSLSRDYHQKLEKVTSEIYLDAGKEFNMNSPKQLGEVLFDEMGLTAKGLKKTEGGARSTRESELEKLRAAHPIIEKILQYREIQKLLSTYIDTIPKMVDKNNRLHTTLNLAGTTTGRMSSINPNLQNIPVREGMGAGIRNAFIAPKGKILLALDYAQIEMRVLAMLSGDEGLKEIFESGTDVHTSVAARVFRVAESEVTKEMRRKAKVINFGIIYGMGVNALKTNLNSSREEAQQFYDQYFVTFPRIEHYFKELNVLAEKQGFTETLFKRRRQFRDIRSKIPYVRAQAERMVMNAPIQGTAADFVKIAMREVDTCIKKVKLEERVELLLQVHDELIFELDNDDSLLRHAVPIIQHAMQGVTKFTNIRGIPLLVEAKIGEKWGDMENFKMHSENNV